MHTSLAQADAADPNVARLAEKLAGARLPAGVKLRLWNGFSLNLGSDKPACTLQVHTPAGLRALLFRPNSLKLGEAYIYGDCDVTGNLRDVFPIADELSGGKASFLDRIRAAGFLLRHACKTGNTEHAAKLRGDRASPSRT